jgi:hypothetical protein
MVKKKPCVALPVVLLLGRIIQSCYCIATHHIDVSFGNCYWCCHGRIYTPCVYVLCSTGTVVGCSLSQYIVCVLVIPWGRPAGQSHSIPYTLIEHFNRSLPLYWSCTVAILPCRVIAVVGVVQGGRCHCGSPVAFAFALVVCLTHSFDRHTVVVVPCSAQQDCRAPLLLLLG